MIDLEEGIRRILKEHPEGLTISSLAKAMGLHRHTAAKYVKGLAEKGEIKQRKIGMAKLCYLKKESVEASMGRKSQAKILFFAILLGFILTQAAIFAYNTTNNSTEVRNESALLPILKLDLQTPKKVTRGEVVELRASVENTGPIAKAVRLLWKLPSGFEAISGNLEENCGDLLQNSSCSSTIRVEPSLSTKLGPNDVRVIVEYE